jgi:hypothetical protein
MKAECFGTDLSCESIRLIVDEPFSITVVRWKAGVVECIVICLRVGEIKNSWEKDVSKCKSRYI